MDEDQRLKEAFLDVLTQSCGVWKEGMTDDKYNPRSRFAGYDSMCMSAYENALDLAVEFGWIEKEQVLR